MGIKLRRGIVKIETVSGESVIEKKPRMCHTVFRLMSSITFLFRATRHRSIQDDVAR